MSPTFVALDLETSGLDAERDAIIEIAAVRFTEDGVVEELQTLVDPGVDLSPRVRQITGLSPADLAGAPPPGVAAARLARFAGGDPVVGHNVAHDLAFVARAGARLGGPAYDTFELATILVPEARRYGLDVLLDTLGIPAADKHRALADAHAHRALFAVLLERARRIDPTTLRAINRLAAGSTWALGDVFRLAAATPVALGARPAAPPPAPPPPLDPAPGGDARLDAGALDALLAPGGALDRRMPGFEDRPGQRAMMRRIAEGFNDGDHLLVEAGTGTGKSLAYLVPALAWSVASGRPVVVATHTITLQDQLVTKDAPAAVEVLGVPARVALLKGRANYLCRTRLAAALGQRDLDAEVVAGLAKIAVWADRTTTGDRAGLMLRPEDERAWRLVSADGEACTPERCPHAARGRCWVQLARGLAEAAHVVVVSHALLVSDVATENRILPRHRHLIIDEAHHLEDVATETLGFRAGAAALREAVAALAGSSRTALPARLEALLAPAAGPETGALRERLHDLRAAGRAADGAAVRLFEAVAAFGEAAGEGRGGDVRLTEALRHRPDWQAVEAAWDAALDPLLDLREGGARLHQALVALERQMAGAAADVAELGGAVRALGALVDGLQRVVADPGREDITWVGRAFGRAWQLCQAPLSVGEALSRGLFGDKELLVLASATLRAPDFAFLQRRLWLDDADGVVFPSPFDYARRVLLYVADDLPMPGQPDYQRQLDRALVDLALACRGRMLVLFTSHGGLRESYHAIRGPLGREGIAVLGQGLDGSRGFLLDALREPDMPSVLLGTRSFWEGVDVPGEALSCVAIARLPFDVPSDPVFAARSETFEEPFEEYSVPQAILRFRQGFGRLVRSASDRGVVAVLDSRVARRRYGELFLEALPPCHTVRGRAREIGPAARRFLADDAIFAPRAVLDTIPGPGDGGEG